jgi:hypothetical protein
VLLLEANNVVSTERIIDPAGQLATRGCRFVA